MKAVRIQFTDAQGNTQLTGLLKIKQAEKTLKQYKKKISDAKIVDFGEQY